MSAALTAQTGLDVTSVAFLGKSTRDHSPAVAVGTGSDGGPSALLIYDPSSLREVVRADHPGSISCCADFSGDVFGQNQPGTKFVCTGASDGVARVWAFNGATLELSQAVELSESVAGAGGGGESKAGDGGGGGGGGGRRGGGGATAGGVTAVACATEDAAVVSVTEGGRLSRHQVGRGGKSERTDVAQCGAAFFGVDFLNSNSKVVVTAGASPGAQVQLWDLREGGSPRRPAVVFADPSSHSSVHHCVAGQNRGGGTLFATGNDRGTVFTWDQRQPGGAVRMSGAHAVDHDVWAVAFSPRPHYLLSGGEDGRVVVGNIGQEGNVEGEEIALPVSPPFESAAVLGLDCIDVNSERSTEVVVAWSGGWISHHAS